MSSPSIERPRISLNTTKLTRRPSESPASPQFRQAESLTSMDPTTLHAIARASSEGEALRAVSQRSFRDRNRSSTSSVERKTALQAIQHKPHPVQQNYQRTYSRLSPNQQADADQASLGMQSLVDTPVKLSFGDQLPSKRDAAASDEDSASDLRRATLRPEDTFKAAEAEKEAVGASADTVGSEEKPPTKRSLLKRLGFSRFPSTSVSPDRHRDASDATATQSLERKQSRLPSVGVVPSDQSQSTPPMRNRRFSISSISTVDSHGDLQPPVRAYQKSKVHRVKTKLKNKDAREFGHLFLAQELQLHPTPTPNLRTASIKGSPSLESASSFNPLDSSTSLPLSSGAPSSDHGHGASATSSTTPNSNCTKKPAVWASEFSKDGTYLAVAGHDAVVRVWRVLSSPQSPPEDQQRMSNEQEPLADEPPSAQPKPSCRRKACRVEAPVFEPSPVLEYYGHSGDVLDLSWSKNNFLLSSSMDKTVRLWHVSRPECLCIFQHSDFVTSVAFRTLF